MSDLQKLFNTNPLQLTKSDIDSIITTEKWRRCNEPIHPSEKDLAIIKNSVSYNPETGDLIWKSNSPYRKAGAIAGWVLGTGYRAVKIEGKNYLVHRIAWFLSYGEFPKGLLDHIDRNPGNNRLSNLRAATKSENCLNKATKAIGVTFQKQSGKWIAQSRGVYIGIFKLKEEAIEAYQKYAVEHGYV